MVVTKVPQPVDIEVGRRVRERRFQLRMSQECLAEKIGVTFQQVQKYEKGTNRIGASRLVLVATALGLAPASLLPDASEGAAEPPPQLGGQAYRVARDFEQIVNPKLRQAIAQTVAAAAHPTRPEAEVA
ncbi:MAG TPA: helix-turn-helix transcriptional regulator [Kaistia sp.]|nr:helix-turn-helix transcriptional regulator [Kaistia sp.]